MNNIREVIAAWLKTSQRSPVGVEGDRSVRGWRPGEVQRDMSGPMDWIQSYCGYELMLTFSDNVYDWRNLHGVVTLRRERTNLQLLKPCLECVKLEANATFPNYARVSTQNKSTSTGPTLSFHCSRVAVRIAERVTASLNWQLTIDIIVIFAMRTTNNNRQGGATFLSWRTPVQLSLSVTIFHLSFLHMYAKQLSSSIFLSW